MCVKTCLIIILYLKYSKCGDVFFLVNQYNPDTYFCVTNSSNALSWVLKDTTQTLDQESNFIHIRKKSTRKPKCFQSKSGWTCGKSLTEKVIYDRRWEELTTYTTDYVEHENTTNNSLKFITTQNNLKEDFDIPLSIRIEKEAHIFLCDGEDVTKSRCYWFLLYGNNGKTSVLKKRKRWLKSCDKNDLFGCYKNKVMKHHKELLSNEMWTHFILSKSKNKLSLKKVTNKEELLLEYEDQYDVINVTHMIIHSKKVVGLWKIHEVEFYHSSEKTPPIRVNEPTDVVEGSICVSMFIRTCISCQIKMELRGIDNNVIAGQNFNGEKVWTEIKFTVNNVTDSVVNLYITAVSTSKKESNRHWSFGSLKYCHKDGFRMIESHQNANCQLIADTTRILDISRNIKITRYDTCNANTLTSLCIPCSWFTNKRSCGKLKICDGEKCSCSAGYKTSSTSTKCSEKCDKGFYGPNCQNKCEKCANFNCSVVDGRCNSHCIDEYSGPKCDIPPEFNNSRKDRNVSYDSTSSNQRPETFMVKYKLTDASMNPTRAQENLCSDENGTIKIDKLQPGNTNLVRCVVTKRQVNNLSFEDKPPTANFASRCDEITGEHNGIKDPDTSAEKQKRCKYHVSETKINPHEKEDTIQNSRVSEIYFSSFKNLFVKKISKTFQTSEKSRVKNLTSRQISSNTVLLEWQKPESPNGDIQNYTVKYRLISRKGCKSVINTPDIYIITRQPSTHISHLIPYSTYSFSVFATNSASQGEVTTVTQQLKESEIINEDEIPKIELMKPKPRSVDIIFSRISCTKLNGPLFIELMADCSTDWCSNNRTGRFNVGNTDNSLISLGNLSPFTNYTLRMKFCRNNQSCSVDVRKETFATPPETPYKVRGLLVYSKNTHSISVRWKPPHPPTGTLDLYKMECSSLTTNNNKKVFNISNTNNCELWPEYHCYTIYKLSQGEEYRIAVLAKNKETSFGHTTTMEAKTVIEKPGPPASISLSWTLQNKLEVFWNHPILANGDISSFIVSVVPHKHENESVLENRNVTKPSRIYKKIIEARDILPSTRYRITVRAFNGYLGDPITKEDTSPPKIPTFKPEPQWSTTNKTISLTIPPQDIENNNYTLLLLRNDGKINNHTELQSFEKKFNIDLSTSTVLYQCQLQDKKKLELIIGGNINNNCTANAHEFLSPGTTYNFTILLKNTDSNNNSSYKLFSYTHKTLRTSTYKGHNRNLFALLLLLLVIPVVVLIFLKKGLVNFKYNSTIKQYLDCNSAQDEKFEEIEFPAMEEQPNSNEERQLLLVQELNETKIVNFLNSYQIEMFHVYVKESAQNGKLITQCQAVNIPEYDEPSGPLSYDFVDMHYKTENISKAYIISTVPNKQHIHDFWKLIHNNKVEDIVLLDNIKAKVQGETYWPDLNTTYQCDDISVLCFMEKVYSKFERRMFRIRHNDSIQNVSQLRFCSPLELKSPLDFVPFFQEMLKIPLKNNSPVLVHGKSPDITETGFILLCDMTLRTALQDEQIDILAHLKNLHNSCVSMKNDSYKMANLVVLETLLFRELNNNIADNDITNGGYFTEEKFRDCVEYLKKTIWIDKMITKNHSDYTHTIRSKDVNSLVDEFDTVLIDGYKVPEKFLLMQNPTPDKFDKLWSMIIQMEISYIVSLNNITPRTNVFWPMSPKRKVLLPMKSKLKLQGIKRMNGYEWLTLHLTNSNSDVHKEINIFSVTNWSSKNVCPPKMTEFVRFCAEINSITRNSNAVLVTSQDGFTASSIYVTMDYIVTQLNFENKCDICTSFRTVRQHLRKGGFSEEKFRFLWEASKHYLQTSQSYL